MIEKKCLVKEIGFAEQNRMSMHKFYQDVGKAMECRDAQSIWQLSKMITRYSIR